MPMREHLARVVRTPWGAGAAGLVVGVVGLVAIRELTRGRDATLPQGVAPPRTSESPFATIHGDPVWPVDTADSRYGQVAYIDTYGDTHGNWSRRFGAPRDDHTHAGVDLYANYGDPVLAMEDGVVVATQTFHLGSSAILVEHDGAVVLYGEVEPSSWKEFGVQSGSRVKRGQPIARIACMVHEGKSCKSHMLHFETYRPGTRQNKQWHGGTPPSALLDPSYLLLTAAPAGANT